MTNYPENDEGWFEDTLSSVVDAGDNMTVITTGDGISFMLDSDPRLKVGVNCRFYGRGLGDTVRGLFVNGEQLFYRTAEEEQERRQIEIYGADAKEWLKRWDNDHAVWSVELGGMGPSYEQCIQVLVAEYVRAGLQSGIDFSSEDSSRHFSALFNYTALHPTINQVHEHLGPSGAQVGAAKWFSYRLLTMSPKDAVEKSTSSAENHILVSRSFPSYVYSQSEV